MNIHALRDILSGVYSINPMQIPYYEHMLYALRNGAVFETDDKELEEFKTFLLDATVGRTTTASGSAPAPTQIAVHNQKGVILRDSMGCGHVGTRAVGQRLLNYDSQDEVMAQVIVLNTPGGDSRAFEEIRDAITKCEKPVYAWVDVMCCSAGLHIAAFCKEIYAHRATDIVGSIGTYAEYAGYKNGDKDGEGRIHYRVYAEKSTKKNKEFEALMQDGNVELVQSMANKYRDRFTADILANRPNATDEDHCNGDTWDASEVEGTLIDGIKTWEELIDHIVEENTDTNSSGGTSSNSAINNQNQKSMKELTLLVALMASAGLGDLTQDAEGDLTLSEEQLGNLNEALKSYKDGEAVKAIETERDNALQAKQDAEANLATANDRIADLEKETPAGSAGKTPPGESGKTAHQETQEAMADAAALIKEIEG